MTTYFQHNERSRPVADVIEFKLDDTFECLVSGYLVQPDEMTDEIRAVFVEAGYFIEEAT